MPWSGKEFAEKHNHKLTGKAATSAGKQATTLVNNGMPEGEAIAIANKHGDRLQAKRTAASSPRSADEHMAARKAQGLSHREVARDFGTSKSTAHRKVAKIMQNGYVGQGSAR
jgi:DNA-binding transcriptional regulator YiaG